MRKMTKTVAVLAAMSAMTIASASMAFAATGEVKNLSALGKEAAAETANTGEWDGNDVDGWTFTPSGESKLKKTWAQIDGAWYYFNSDGIMAQDELKYIDGETYYFDKVGRMMSDGWVKFSNSSDVLYEYGINVTEYDRDLENRVTSDPYSSVWMCFNEDGTAKDDEWYQAESGLWYYFDDVVMVAGDFDHVIGGDRYGFDKNGAMLVGWAEDYEDYSKSAPNTDGRTWYWYDTNGKKFKANIGYQGAYGWKKIDGEWYCFTAKTNAASVGTLITKAFFTNDAAADGNSDYYYVDGNGVMQTGVVTVDKEALFVGATAENRDTTALSYTWTDNKKIKHITADGKGIEVYIDTNGKVQADTWKNDRFYAAMWATNVIEFDRDDFANTTNAVSDSGYVDAKKNAAIKGALVKSAFITKSGKKYFVDEDGDKVKNEAIEVGRFTGTTFEPQKANNGDTGVFKAFVLAPKSGEIYVAGALDAGRKVTIGSKTYVATGDNFKGMQVFKYSNEN